MKKMDILITVLRILFVMMVVGIVVLFIYDKDLISIETIINITPERTVVAILFFALIYALKSLSIFFPIVVLQAAAGIIFSAPLAILVSFLGAAVEVSVPYVMAKYSSSTKIQKMIQKYPKVEDIIEKSTKNEFLLSLMLRLLGFLPIDVVSMALGSMKLNYPRFLVGSLLGLSPGIIAVTIAGNSITDPTSPAFIISISATVIIAICSTIVAFIYYKKKNKATKESNE